MAFINFELGLGMVLYFDTLTPNFWGRFVPTLTDLVVSDNDFATLAPFFQPTYHICPQNAGALVLLLCFAT